jgi:hypothetical protein
MRKRCLGESPPDLVYETEPDDLAAGIQAEQIASR